MTVTLTDVPGNGPVNAPFNAAALARAFFARDPILAAATVFLFLLCLPILAAMAVDQRSLLGVNLWTKPLKFSLSIVTYFAALVWIAGWIPGMTRTLWHKVFISVIAFCAVAEMAWIIGAAANGVASHWNASHWAMSLAYTFAGIFAVTLLVPCLVYAWKLRRDTALAPALRASVILGLLATFALTFVFAGYLGGAGGHEVGGDGTDAQGMIATGWSRDGGDLRVAHFFALHAIHFLPALGLIAAWAMSPARGRVVVGLCALGYVAFTVWTFAEAVAGRAFLPML